MLRVASRAARAAAAAAARRDPRAAAAARRDPRAAAAATAPWDPLAALGAWLRQQRGVKTQSNELRGGQVIERDGRLLVVVEAKHTQGQGRASGFVQLQARDVRSGTKYVERLSPSDMVERVTLDRVDYTFLYNEGKNVVLMDPRSFEQFELPAALLGDAGAFLTDGVTVTVAKLQSGEPVSATLPDTIEAEITACSASMKNERKDGNQLKSATLVNGATLQVPGFVKEGDIVIVRPSTGEFVKRKL